MRNKDFAVFILTHGRPDNVYTYDTIRRIGYTGKIYIIIDNEDKEAQKYRDKYGDIVKTFDKLAISKTFDEGDNFSDRRTVVYARNACFDIARELGVTYFLQLDDDYTTIIFRINQDLKYPTDHWVIKTRLDYIFDIVLDYYKSIDAKSIAIAQGGDFMGGASDPWKLRRKCMNTFFCSTERPFQFVGRINEDVNTYTWYQSLGNLFLTIPFTSILQKETQQTEGGMTDIYLTGGTYIKSFYTVMYMPSSVSINLMGQAHKRFHHLVKWNNTVPKIIREMPL